jgi:hypothetical protein
MVQERRFRRDSREIAGAAGPQVEQTFKPSWLARDGFKLDTGPVVGGNYLADDINAYFTQNQILLTTSPTFMKTSPGIILANLAVAATIMTFSACAPKSTTGTTEGATTTQPAPATAAVEPAQPSAAVVPPPATPSQPAAATPGKVTLTVVKVDSEETAGENGRGVNAVDGDPNTVWHTQWQDANPPQPHEIIIELTPPSTIKGFTYLPRQDDSQNGMIKDYEFYISDDGNDFGQPVKSGTFENSKEKKTVAFDAKKCRFIKLKSLSEVNDQPWASAAEIGVIPGD